MTKTTPEPKLWRSGFCLTDDALPWQHAACQCQGGGHRRTPTKADPRDWMPCCCSCHREPDEPLMPDTVPDQLAPTPLPVAVELVALAAERLSTAATGAIEPLGWEDAIRLLDVLRDAAHTIGQVDALLVRQAYLRGPHGKNAAELDGIGPVSIGRSPERKHWDERGVARAVIDRHMEAAENLGEAPDPWTVAEWLLEVYGVGYCRVTPLRALGLEPEAFCDETPGKPTVSLPPRH